MRRLVGVVAILGLILMAVLVNSLLRAPPAAPPAGGPIPAPPVDVRPPPPMTVTRSSDASSVDVALELVLVDAVTREPLDEASVTLKPVKSGEGEQIYDLTGEGDGIYRLTQRPADGPYALSASAAGYECLRWDFALTAADRSLNVELRPLVDLVVIVEDSSGEPVPDADVTLKTAGWAVFRCVHPRDEEETLLLQPLYEEVSDAEGVAVFGELVPGEGYAVSAGAADRTPGRVEDIHLESVGPRIVKVVLDVGARIVGTIRDSQSAPGAGFTVRCRRRVKPPSGNVVVWEEEMTVRSRENGYFELGGLSPGAKKLEVFRRTRSRLETCIVEVNLRRGRTHDCGVIGPTPLSEGGANLTVQVADESGQALPGVRVLVMKDNPDPVDDSVSTNEDGKCSVRGLNPGRVRISAHWGNGDYGTETAEVALEPGDDKELVLVLKKVDRSHLRTLIVRLRQGNSGPPMSEIVDRFLTPYVEDSEGEWASPNWRSAEDQDGAHLVFAGVRPGNYRAMVLGNGLITRAEPVYVEDPESEVELVLEEAIEVRGRLVDASSGAGVSGSVTRLLEASAAPGNRERGYTARTDSEGRFGLQAFGSWEERGVISVTADGYAGKIVEFHPGVGDIGVIPLSRGK